MENLILQFKKEQQFELNIENNKNARQKVRYAYINETINTLKDKFHELMELKIEFSDFLTFLKNIDNEIIYQDVLNRMIKITAEIITHLNNKENENPEKLKKLIDIFYHELKYLIINLKRINHGKYTKILLLDQSIEEITKSIELIDNNGEFSEPINTKTLVSLLKQIKYSKINIMELMQEITIKNNKAIRNQLARQNAIKIRERKQAKRKLKVTTTESTFNTTLLNEEQKQIYNNAKQIIETELNKLEPINKIEESFISDLYLMTNLDEIKLTIELMSDNYSSLKLIIYGLKHKLDTLSEKNLEQNLHIIKEYLKHYKDYKNKIKEEQEENLKNQEEIEKLSIELDKIINEITEDHENIIEKLTDNQLNILLSLQDIDANTDDETLNQINETLKKVDLNVEFLIFYNIHKELYKNISHYNELNSIYKITEKLKKIKEIIKEYENYTNAKDNYIETVEYDEELNEIDQKQATNQNQNIVLYLTDNNQITFAEKYIKDYDALSQTEYNAVLELINKLKTHNSTYIHTIAKNVLPKDENYKKRRLRKGNIRLVFYQINNKVLNTDKPVFLIITAGKKFSLSSPIYDQANHLKSKVLEFIKNYTNTLNNTDEQKIETFLNEQKHIETTFLENIPPTNESTKKAGGRK